MVTLDQAQVSELKVEFRSQAGKGAARKLRRHSKIPGVFYGSRREPVRLSVDPDRLRSALNTPKLLNTLLRIVSDHPDLNGRVVMVREIQRDPLSRKFIHVDLMEVYEDRSVRVKAPILLKGHAIGVDMGGTLEQHIRQAEIKCPADKIPPSIDIDVTELKIGQTIRLEDLSLGEDIELIGDKHASLATVVAPRVLKEEEVEEEEVEGEEAAEAEEGAKAAEAAEASEDKEAKAEKKAEKDEASTEKKRKK
jgi:large subunit ribosomal protein L25